MGDSILPLLTFFGKHRLEGRSEEIALEALEGYEMRGDNSSIAGLWGNRVGPRLEARVLELASNDNHEVRHGAIYFGLSTFADKSPAVVEALIETLTDPDFNNSGRALWGLGHGVPPASHARVVDALVELHNGRSSPNVRADCRRIVGMYGGEAGLARLAE
jgi:HEAT repeat protein